MIFSGVWKYKTEKTSLGDGSVNTIKVSLNMTPAPDTVAQNLLKTQRWKESGDKRAAGAL